jgi:hypothetical protein
MVNIITIKWGTKYSASYANRVYSECKERCTFDFTFYCVTDDPIGLDKNIIALDMPTHSNLNFNNFIDKHLVYKTQMWDRPKLYLFTDFNRYFKGTNIFLDLDAQINEDLKYLTTLPKDKPWIIDMWWKINFKEHWDKLWGTRVNSSVIVWQDDQCASITEKILKDTTLFDKYATIDCFIGYELTDYSDYNNCYFNSLPPFVAIMGKSYQPGYLIRLWSNSKHGRHTQKPGI